MDCPDPDGLLDYLAGRLDARATARTRQHIATCQACHGVATDLVQSAASGVGAASGFVAPKIRVMAYELARGATIAGRYVLEEELGSGAMGIVWRASCGRDRVAIKLLKGFDTSARKRFAREASISSSLVHSGLVGIIEVLPDVEAGCPALVMELLDGEPLSKRLRASTLSPREACRLGGDVARALAYVHERRVVHRDLKPANVFLTHSGAKLLDLGLAAITDDAERITRTGHTVGTPAYMAPEQLAGASVDGRADVWSLGITIYEAVSGRLPFAGRSPADLLRTIARSSPPIFHAGPPAFAALLSEMLAQTKDHRPSMANVAARFAAIGQAW